MLDPKAPRAGRRWQLTGTSDGLWDPPGLKPSGRKMDIEGVAIFEFRGEQACEVRMTFDVAGMMRQVGVLPANGSTGERITVVLVNLRNWVRRR